MRMSDCTYIYKERSAVTDMLVAKKTMELVCEDCQVTQNRQ